VTAAAKLIARIEEFLGDAEHFELADGSTVDIMPAGKALDGLKEIFAAQAKEIERLEAALTAARNRIEDDAQTIDRHVAKIGKLQNALIGREG